jgi:hypothetical protein
VDPRCTLAYFNRGTTFQALGRPDRAAQDFREILKVDPTYAPARKELELLGK